MMNKNAVNDMQSFIIEKNKARGNEYLFCKHVLRTWQNSEERVACPHPYLTCKYKYVAILIVW